MLAELDGTVLSGVYLGERLKEFFPQRGIDRQGVEGFEESDGSDEAEENVVNSEEIGGNEADER